MSSTKSVTAVPETYSLSRLLCAVVLGSRKARRNSAARRLTSGKLPRSISCTRTPSRGLCEAAAAPMWLGVRVCARGLFRSNDKLRCCCLDASSVVLIPTRLTSQAIRSVVAFAVGALTWTDLKGGYFPLQKKGTIRLQTWQRGGQGILHSHW